MEGASGRRVGGGRKFGGKTQTQDWTDRDEFSADSARTAAGHTGDIPRENICMPQRQFRDLFRPDAYPKLGRRHRRGHSRGRRGRKIRVEGIRRPDQRVSHHRMVPQRRLVERIGRFGPQIVENGTPSAWRSARKKLRAGSGWRECKYAYVECSGKLL